MGPPTHSIGPTDPAWAQTDPLDWVGRPSRPTDRPTDPVEADPLETDPVGSQTDPLDWAQAQAHGPSGPRPTRLGPVGPDFYLA